MVTRLIQMAKFAQGMRGMKRIYNYTWARTLKSNISGVEQFYAGWISQTYSSNVAFALLNSRNKFVMNEIYLPLKSDKFPYTDTRSPLEILNNFPLETNTYSFNTKSYDTYSSPNY